MRALTRQGSVHALGIYPPGERHTVEGLLLLQRDFRGDGIFARTTLMEQQDYLSGTKAAMELAYHVGAPVVVNHIGRVPADTESAAWRLLVEVLDELGRHGHRAGALLAAETGSESGHYRM